MASESASRRIGYLLLGCTKAAALGRVGRSRESSGAGCCPEELHTAGIAAHLERNLGLASALYDQALQAEPALPTSAESLAFVRRIAPRIFTTADEPFGLRDAAAIVPPTSGIIAYHLFWEDDIDFPDDNDPTDHEVIWIRADRRTGAISDLWTYFHGRILHQGVSGAMSVHRPRVEVQWGKHGSLPPGWRGQMITAEAHEAEDGIPQSADSISLERYLDGSFRKLRDTRADVGRTIRSPRDSAGRRASTGRAAIF